MPLVDVDSRKIYYERHGAGPAILFCHGAGSNAATWWQQLPVFAREFTCLTLDFRCFGRSRAPLDEFTFAHFVADVTAILDAEGIDEVTIVGQSLGGMVGLRLALQSPERVAAFVACDTSFAVDHPVLQDRMAQRVIHGKALSVEQKSLGRDMLEQRPDLAALYAQINHYNPSAYEYATADWNAAMAGLMTGPDLLAPAALAGLSCPTLLVVGDEDPLVPVAVFEEFRDLIPGAELHVVRGAGHSAYFEKAEEFNARVLGFLRAHRR